ncbi:MAG: aminoacyl-tRNA hydrolase [Saprospiraceae bacterium]|nr:aminoacyl-tRNA hydrolase [Saprospiraceae bacterium]
MKYLIIGLGNIGSEYENTRHNIGFDIVTKAAQELNVPFKVDTLGSIAEGKWKGRSLFFLKPSTYMNLSGKAVLYWMQKLKIPIENLMIIVDDIHLDLGKLRLRDKGSDGGHNGLKDIQNKFGHSNYCRLRVGVGKDFFPGQQVVYVLGKWKKEELDEVNTMIDKSVNAIKNFCTIGLKFTTDNLNK